MGPLQQVPLFAWCLLVSLPLWGIVTRRRRNISEPSRVKAPDHYTSEPSGVEAAVQVNDSLDRMGKQSDVPTKQILFFHGFPLEDFSNVHLSTWDNGDGWPQVWLEQTFPGAQIFFVKYGAALRNSKVFHMNNIAENLISDLLQANVGQVPDCPVVMVGHCVGGLVIKALCWKAHEELHSSDTLMNDRAKKLEAFLERVSGIFYYSTPHRGIREIPERLRSRDNALFTYFQVLSTDTAELNSNFSKLCKRYPKWKIEGVGESLPAKLGVFQNVLVVPEASARDGDQVFTVLKGEDHFSVCKPKTRLSGGFYHLTGFLTKIEEEEIKLREETRSENFQKIPKAVVGIQFPLKAVIEELKAVCTLGLTGMGGSGKTTLAKAVFNELWCNFEYTCFVPDVKLIKGTVETVKQEVWKHVYCNRCKVGGEMRWSLLRGKRLLLVLDDIADSRDIAVLSELADGPSLDSRFIATSRNDDLFESYYKVPRLDETNHDTELFMSYAFPNTESPSPQWTSLIEEIVKKCEGLPLTLEVLGKWLRKSKDAGVWKETLKALDEAELVIDLNEKLWAKLRPSIDGLEEKDKQMFLDASTFFHNNSWTLREAKAAWRVAYGGMSELRWQTLLDRSLVYSVKDDDYIKVHEQLRSLGRKIADESKANIDIRTLEDFELLQSANELERKNIRAVRIKVDQPYREENHPRQSTLDDGDSAQISSEDGKVHIGSLALQELKELSYLDVNNHGEIDGTAEEILFPRRLILLRCVGLNTFSLAQQRRLVVLRISGVTSLPNAIGQLSSLRIFTLFDCENLRTLPNSFRGLSALERVLFHNCGIETLPESFGKLSALKYLRFNYCGSLKSLPESFGLLGALVDLMFHSCDSLESLPSPFGHLPSLSRLEFAWCPSLKNLPESFGKLSALKYLLFSDCSRLKSLPESFGLLGALADLNFHGCHSLESLPSTFGHLSALSRLELRRCWRLKSLPESFGKLSALKYLYLHGCRFRSLPLSFGLLGALADLKILTCDKLESLPDTFGHLSTLSRLEFSWCPSLKNLPESFGKLSALRYLWFNNCSSLESLPESFGLLGALVDLKFKGCNSLESLPNTFGHLSALSRLKLKSCSSLESLPESFGLLGALVDLKFNGCNSLESLPNTFGHLSALSRLKLKSCSSLESLPESFGLLGALVDLKFKSCNCLESLPNTFGHLPSLSRLELKGCTSLKSLPESFGKLSALKYLEFKNCSLLRSLPESFGLLGALVDLKFEDCSSLKSLPNTFGHLYALSRLEFVSCSNLQSFVESPENLPGLRHLNPSSRDVLYHQPESLGRLAKLEYLKIDDNEKLKRLPESVAELGSLRHLSISKLWSLNGIPDYVQNLPSLRTLELSVLPEVKELPPWLGGTGVNWLGVLQKVCRIQDCQFSLTHESFTPFELVSRIHIRARKKVRRSDYEGALAELEVRSLGTPELDGFLLQEKGIIKRMMGDLHGALEDLTAALECFSNVGDGHHYSYDSWKHRGYVKFLMEDMEGADNDGTIALKLQLDYEGSIPPDCGVDSLGDVFVEYMHFRLEPLYVMWEHESLLIETLDKIRQKVKVPDFQGALASFDVINVPLLRKDSRALFLQERGVLKRLAGDLDGALEDLKAALEIGGDNYNCLKHRGYVKYLLGDLAGASCDAERCLQVWLPNNYPVIFMGEASVAFMGYNLV